MTALYIHAKRFSTAEAWARANNYHPHEWTFLCARKAFTAPPGSTLVCVGRDGLCLWVLAEAKRQGVDVRFVD